MEEIVSSSMRLDDCRQHLLYTVGKLNIKCKENKNHQKVYYATKLILKLDPKIHRKALCPEEKYFFF